MKEDIENGFYNDPFEYDFLKEEDFNDYAESVKLLQENTHFLKDYDPFEYEDPETAKARESNGGFIMDRDRWKSKHQKTKRIAVGAWDSPGVDVEWPEPLVDAFMDELEEFREKGGNSAWENKALCDRILQRYGDKRFIGGSKK
jgi:hypothetical protein